MLQITSLPEIAINQIVHTPNGFHIICEPFNPKLVEQLQDVVSIKKDALVYIETITVPINM